MPKKSKGKSNVAPEKKMKQKRPSIDDNPC
jgi:hypothetical protein